ncbi:EamA family transporter [Angustibacter sp. Root456]|uniref:EamA family transporter n=1 Tax=Angustibacter sp. Root456 TaxID=1736539 RepID=UPI0006F4FF57|nr:EamA family transporter [Angustibacter sp. Root456]KQX65947.1 ABC transporter permease [Angustibacter sp. Root456]
MEVIVRTSAVTAVAPVVWGSTYLVTSHLLPSDRPLFGAAVRALPVGLVLLALTRRRPRASWWLKASVLGTLNIGAFFVLIYVTAQLLPSGIAATLTAFSPLVMMALAWPLLGQRPAPASVTAALVGLVGVALLVLRGGGSVPLAGVAASVAAMTMASLGFILVKRWTPPVPLLAFTAWQLVAGGVVLAPVALVVEGPPPALDLPAVAGFAYLAVIGTGAAYAAWFHGLSRLDPGAVALIGLLNPLVGTALGVVVAHEAFGAVQLIGTALVAVGIAAGQPAVRARFARRTISPDLRRAPLPSVGGGKEMRSQWQS